MLAKKIGQALIKSHHYNKAISYYSAALKSGHQNLLRFDLAELYTKLNQVENAEKIIQEALSDTQSTDPEYLAMQAKCYVLSFEISQKGSKSDQMVALLDKARECQLKAIKRAQVDNPDLIEEFKNNMSQ